MLYHVVSDVNVNDILSPEGHKYLRPFISAAKQLEDRGVKAITTSCGCLALFQSELSKSVSVPLFASTLLQVPLVHRMLRPEQKVGVIAADATLLTNAHYQASGWSTAEIPIAVSSMRLDGEFSKLMLQNEDISIKVDFDEVEKEVCGVVRAFVNGISSGALVLECTNLVPYAFRYTKRNRASGFRYSYIDADGPFCGRTEFVCKAVSEGHTTLQIGLF